MSDYNEYNGISINQETLCEFCCNYHDSHSFRNRCEGSQCESMAENYLDDVGISDAEKKEKCFRDLKIDDNIYRIMFEKQIPKIETSKISGVYHSSNDSYLNISSKDFSGLVIEKKESYDKKYKAYFISRIDAEKRLEEICLKMILDLSKVIGSINGVDKAV